MHITVLVGTDKGAFVCRSDEARANWTIEGPLFKGWKVTAAERDPNGNYLLGTASFVYGAAIQKSSDLKEWKQVPQGPAYGEGSDAKLSQIWRIAAVGDTLYAGVADAGLFRSTDGGDNWTPLNGLNQHKSRKAWCPGAGGLCAHAILFDPKNPRRLWCGISAVGVFRSEDGGETWDAKNQGVPVILEDKNFPEVGFCVHALAQDPTDANRIYRQDHRGMFRSTDGGDSWERNENGLKPAFGFPLAIDRNTRALFAVPLESDEYRVPKDGKMAIYRSRDGGDSWQPLTRGLPQENAFAPVMRGALAVDNLSPGGVYAGTTAGDVYYSRDGGDSWNALPCRLPRVHCVAAFTG